MQYYHAPLLSYSYNVAKTTQQEQNIQPCTATLILLSWLWSQLSCGAFSRTVTKFELMCHDCKRERFKTSSLFSWVIWFGFYFCPLIFSPCFKFGYVGQGGIILVNLSTRLTRNLKTSHEIFVGSPKIVGKKSKEWNTFTRIKFLSQEMN